MSIADNLRIVTERIADASVRAGREPDAVKLIAVSKTFPTEAIAEASLAGQQHFGENRVQEGLAKLEQIHAQGVNAHVHLIGHLQRNKARHAGSFASVQSVDSVRLAEAISRRLSGDPQILPILPILLEVNVAEEPTKHGFSVSEVPSALDQIRALPNIRVDGLMTVAPEVADPEDVRPVFRTLRTLSEQLALPQLSMGMSNDYAVAIEEGSTMVRIGRAIFGERGAPA